MTHSLRDTPEAIDTAKTTDGEIIIPTARRLLELVAPDKAGEGSDRQAERDRIHAESSRWFEITDSGIPGVKELRFRAESSVLDTFTRRVASLLQTSPADANAQTPIERRRADAVAEIIDAYARRNLVDQLTADELRQLASHIENAGQGGSECRPDSVDDNTDNESDHINVGKIPRSAIHLLLSTYAASHEKDKT